MAPPPARLRRGALIASPFVLLLVGAVVLFRSPWPAILGRMEHGAHVYVVWSASTAGSLAVVLATFGAALAIAYTIRSR